MRQSNSCRALQVVEVRSKALPGALSERDSWNVCKLRMPRVASSEGCRKKGPVGSHYRCRRRSCRGTIHVWSQIVVGLSSPPGYAPGPYGNFSAAKGIMSRTLRINDEGRSRAEESWDFEGETGDSIRLEIQFVRGIAVRRNAEVRVHSAIKPEFYRIYRIEEAVDVVRSGTERSDRVQRCFFKASGPRLSPLFDGSEQLISIASLPWVSRRVFVPITGAR